jgi:branched-chain amino acid transport system substrate-binding protein
MQTIAHQGRKQMLQNSFKNVVLSAAVVCLSSGVARESKADGASCASPIPLGLTTALTGNLALLGIQGGAHIPRATSSAG